MPPNSAATRQLVHFRGNVQGVGFRVTTRQISKRFAVTGYVRNLADGRVELVAEGANAELSAFLDEIHREMGHHISDVVVDTLAANGEFGDFRIRH